MMYQKACLFEDKDSKKEIMSTENVGKIKYIGRNIRCFDDHIWNGIRQIVVYNALVAKFSQNGILKK